MTVPRPERKVLLRSFRWNFQNCARVNLNNFLFFQLRRVTYWTRHTKELPELTDSEEDDDEDEKETSEEFEMPTGRSKAYPKL